MALDTDQQPQGRTAAHIISIMTTEHFALQGARSATISDTSGRASLFLGSVSSGLIALAFIGQASHLGTAFDVFALVLFPTLFLLGGFTFRRVLQSAVEDFFLALGINRIRHFYLEVAPELSEYFMLSTHDDQAGVMANMAVRPSRWQLFLTTAGMVAVINSVLAGVFGAVVVEVLGPRTLALPTAVGIALFCLSVFAHQRYQLVAFLGVSSEHHPLFPSPPENLATHQASRFPAVHLR